MRWRLRLEQVWSLSESLEELPVRPDLGLGVALAHRMADRASPAENEDLVVINGHGRRQRVPTLEQVLAVDVVNDPAPGPAQVFRISPLPDAYSSGTRNSFWTVSVLQHASLMP
jgi:hypothetical protein